jgi:NAD(P) transhydrogenase subunit alpha
MIHGILIALTMLVLTPGLSGSIAAQDSTAQEGAAQEGAAPSDGDLQSGFQPVALPSGPDNPELRRDASSWGRRETLLASITIFVLAVFLGFELITKVPPTLHTPLMSGSNAISGITIVGAIIAAGTSSTSWLVSVLAAFAVATATVNAVGGFAVTHRMLAMFRR